ncbi:MAG: aminoglycoside phosphotransferase family protein [Myxococcota bacterium]
MQEPLTIAAGFQVPGRPVEGVRYGSGHIHQTWVVRHETGDPFPRSVLQRLNTEVFRDPGAVMTNLLRVTQHLRERLVAAGASDLERRVLTPLPHRDGGYLHQDRGGGLWRCFRFVEGTSSYDTPRGARHATEAARAFGRFVAALSDLPPGELVETIPHFHDLEKRSRDLLQAADADVCDRAERVRRELDRAMEGHALLTRTLEKEGATALPRRCVHNDCKINNVLMDDRSGEGLCVIDLDTVMGGSVLCDFGDLVRTAACPAPEDEVDLERMHVDEELLAALVDGYRRGTGDLLEEVERALLPLAGPLLTLEIAIRFLTDHVSGDVYFRVHRPGHNLDRARAQLHLFDLLMKRVDQTRTLLTRDSP